MIKIPETGIQFVDAVVVIFYIVLIVIGARKGFVRQLISFAGTLLSWFLAWRWCDIFAARFHLLPLSIIPKKYELLSSLIYPKLNAVAWFLLLMLVIRILFALLEHLFEGLEKLPVLKQISHLLGGILGACAATVWVLIFCVLLNTPLFRNGSYVEENSCLGTINNTVTKTFSSLELPYSNAKKINDVLQMLKNDEGVDQQMIEQWLDENGYEKNEDAQ
ncbi:MAG: CvpA family protein [Bulleidia sp.]|nr:CvpA family protein [Bulleidia sp.]